MWALLPLKNICDAKQRLSSVLTPEERSGLFFAMVKDVLTVLQSHPEIDNTLIVSDDVAAQQLACDYGAELLTESELNVCGLNEAVQAGVGDLARRGFDDVMVIHGDLPLVSSAEISQLIDVHQQQLRHRNNTDGRAGGLSALTIAPDERREGTNCLLCSPASNMTYCYGVNSFSLHASQARNISMPLRVAYLPGAACDIDTPQDLMALVQRATPSNAQHSHHYISAHDLAARLALAPVGERESQATVKPQLETPVRVELTTGLDMQYGWVG